MQFGYNFDTTTRCWTRCASDGRPLTYEQNADIDELWRLQVEEAKRTERSKAKASENAASRHARPRWYCVC
jgi:hypothetical protein